MPLPSSVVSKGIWKRSISRRTSAPAPLRIAPKPTSATTFLLLAKASARQSAISATRAGSGSTGFTARRMSW